MYKQRIALILLLLALCIMPASGQYYYNPTYVVSSTGGTEFTSGETVSFVPWSAYGHISGGNVVLYYNVTNSSGIRGDGNYVATANVFVNNTPLSFGIFPSNTETGKFAVLWYQNTGTIISSWYQNQEPLSINFECNPTTGNSPLDVSFSDTSNPNVATHRLWSFGDGQSENTTAQNTTHTYASAGTYTVRLDTYSSTYGWQNLTKLNYITALSIPISNTSFWATNYDPLKSAVVKPSDIKLQNLTSGFWRNVSSTGGTVKFTATDTALTEPITSGQTVKLCGYAPGYAEACANVTIPYSGWEYKINLASTGAVPTGTNATLFVNVLDSYTAEGLAGATVTIANASIPYSKSILSNAGGIASFVDIDPGTYSISATKTGYQSSVTSWTAPSGLVTNAYIGLLPAGMTPVVTGTGGENLYDDNGNPIIGYDLSGNPITAGPTPDTRTDEEKDSEMMDLLRDQGPMLIQFFIVCFVVYMIMGMAGKR